MRIGAALRLRLFLGASFVSVVAIWLEVSFELSVSLQKSTVLPNNVH
jgi:hypothetical protein